MPSPTLKTCPFCGGRRQMNEASPRPWRAIYARVLDARGKTVCVCEKDSMHGRADDETAKADAALIVDAVNEYDGKHQFCTQNCVWMGPEIDRLRKENEIHRLGSEATHKLDGEKIAKLTDERDRLRDLVRRLTEYADAVTGYRPRAVEVLSSEHPAWTFDGAALLREARAALGAGETRTGKGVGV